jgi:NarL family two-component system response regulator LiaR
MTTAKRPEAPIRVLLVDDHAVVRSGLGAFLDAFEDLVLVGEASGGEDALLQCAAKRPDVVIMDLVMPGMDGAEATAEIRRRHPSIQVVALTSFKEEDLVQRVLAAGAIGYLLKSVSAEDLADAVRAAHAGRPTLAPEAARALIDSATRRPRRRIGDDLTDREREILEQMVSGMSNNEIAEHFVVSRSTVKFHVSNILSKLAVGSRTEAVAVALRNNLI